MADMGRRRALSFCAPSLVKQLPQPYSEQTNLQVADGQLPTNALCDLARAPYSFSGTQKSNLYGLVNSQDIGSNKDGDALTLSGAYCVELLEESDQLLPLSFLASRKVAVCAPPPPPPPPSLLTLDVSFAEGHSAPQVVKDLSGRGSVVLRETTRSVSHSSQDSSSPRNKLSTPPFYSLPPTVPPLDSAVVREYLAQVTTKHPFSGLRENYKSLQLDQQKLANKKFSIPNHFLYSPFICPDLYCPLQFPNVASLKMSVQNTAWVEQFKSRSLTPPFAKSPARAESLGHGGGGELRRPLRRRRISETDPALVCPSLADQHLFDSLTSKVEVEQVRHQFKDLEKKSDSTYLKLVHSASSNSPPFKIGDPIFGHRRGGDHASSQNLASSYEKTERSQLLPLASACLSVPSSPRPHRNKSTSAELTPLTSSPLHTSTLEVLSEDSSKPLSVPQKKASAGSSLFGGDDAVARRIRRQEINLMTPVSF